MYQYESEAQANAEIEQTRAEALDVLRTAPSYSVVAETVGGRTFHSTAASTSDKEEPPIAFLTFVAAKALRNVAVLFDGDLEAAISFVKATMEVADW